VIHNIRTIAKREHNPETLAAILSVCPDWVEHVHRDAEDVLLLMAQTATANDVLLEVDGIENRYLVTSDMDDASVWSRALTYSTTHVIVLPDGMEWLRARLNDEPDADKGDQLASGWLNRHHPDDVPTDPMEHLMDKDEKPAPTPLPDGFVAMIYEKPGEEDVAYRIVTDDGAEHRLGQEQIEYVTLARLFERLKAPALMSEQAALDEAIESQGWNLDSVVSVLMAYVESQGSPEAFAHFIAGAVHSENND